MHNPQIIFTSSILIILFHALYYKPKSPFINADFNENNLVNQKFEKKLNW